MCVCDCVCVVGELPSIRDYHSKAHPKALPRVFYFLAHYAPASPCAPALASLTLVCMPLHSPAGYIPFGGWEKPICETEEVTRHMLMVCGNVAWVSFVQDSQTLY